QRLAMNPANALGSAPRPLALPLDRGRGAALLDRGRGVLGLRYPCPGGLNPSGPRLDARVSTSRRRWAADRRIGAADYSSAARAFSRSSVAMTSRTPPYAA